ncbi:hypothetical protein Cgig2_015414 [Carnegiea gigantea]|uniref:Uncharacterized protein n=1 Tax=Carnegiea gigantea TaxID=171969 RepID=A0A9Q1K2F8_9CARY|nr:hypothetical protein Cgig2_015414 [Carnegiea gigantea]
MVFVFYMRGGSKRFVAIESKSFDLAIVRTREDVLKISENGRGRRTSLLLPKNRNWAGKFLQLYVINKGKRTFVIFPAGWNERGWAKIFDALTEIVDRGKQRVVTELGMRASSSVSAQVYSQRNNFRNRRNRVRESKGSSNEGTVSICANWPPNALFVVDTSSPSSDKANSFNPAQFEANICG